MVILEPPETDTHIVIFDAPAGDATAAVTAAWAAYKPGSKRPVKLVTPRPAKEGWDERQVFDYETSPNERAAVVALAFRSGTSWTVAILDGTEPTVEKRGAAVGLVFESLRPKNYKRESFAGRKAHPLDAERVATLTAFVESSMRQLGVPGVSIALIDQGKVVYQGGFGVRELGKPERVDENTVFMAASNTKGMTTLLLSELVDQKKLKWDQPVIEVYPTFKLGDADTTKKVLIKNLICACTGLPRQDLEWLFEYKNATPQSEIALLGTMQPTSKFGEVFQYSNLMAAAAGYIGGHIVYPDRELGAAYDAAMQQMIFDPLGMKSTTFDYAKALAGKDRIRLQPAGAYATNLLGLSEQVPAKAVFFTDGPSRTVKIGRQEIQLRHTTPRNMAAAGRLSGLLMQAFRHLGQEHITARRMAHLKRTLPAKERKQLVKDLPLAPTWMHPFFRELANS